MSLFTLTPNDKQLSEALVELQMRSCWSKPYRTVEIGLYDLLETVERYGHRVLDFTWRDMIPKWRKGHKVWSKEKQISYIENLLLGNPNCSISLYTDENSGVSDCKILDGISQLVAIENFINDKLPVFDAVSRRQGKPPITYTVLKDSTSFIGVSTKVSLSVYHADSESIAINLYLQKNMLNTEHNTNVLDVFEFCSRK